MKASIKVLTLGVDDLERSLAFYRDGLGFVTTGIVGSEFEGGAVVFFEMQGGLILALYPKTQIAKDANLPDAPSDTPSNTSWGTPSAHITLGHNVHSKDEVDAILAEASKAGATIRTQAGERVWGGYTGIFQDLDGHLWEIVWNPQLPPD